MRGHTNLKFAGSVLLLLISALPLAAQAVSDVSPAVRTLGEQLRPGMPQDLFLHDVRRLFRMLDADADGRITAADADMHGAMTAALIRSANVSHILSADIDNDGFVTSEELRVSLRYRGRDSVSQLLRGSAPPSEAIEVEFRSLMEADTDADGRISVTEAIQHAERASRRRDGTPRERESVRAKQLLSLDRGGNGAVTLADLEVAAQDLFLIVDVDRDGKVSAEEIAACQHRAGARAEHGGRAGRP